MLRYSVAIVPPEVVIEEVRQLKQNLRLQIGWYRSVNALAHITFNVFEADTAMLLRYESYVAGFAAQQAPVSLRFDHTGSFSNGAFFLAPDDVSDLLLLQMMHTFHQQWPLPADKSRKLYKSFTPHMSIGRALSVEHLATAGNIIPEADIRFVCDNIVIRRFNESRKQYDIYQRFPFGVTR